MVRTVYLIHAAKYVWMPFVNASQQRRSLTFWLHLQLSYKKYYRNITLEKIARTSASCDFEISTRVFAAGWTTSKRLIIVAPSLEIVAFPTQRSRRKYSKMKYYYLFRSVHALNDGSVLYRTVDLPWLFTISLSIPLGPKVVRTASAINWQAFILLMSWGTPCEASVPSLSKIIPGCCQNNTCQTCERISFDSVLRI